MQPIDLIGAQRAQVAKAETRVLRRQRRVVKEALRRVLLGLRSMRPGSWGAASSAATALLLEQMLREMAFLQGQQLRLDLREVAARGARETARILAFLDKHYLGAVRPLSFQTLEWFDAAENRVNGPRLRMYQRSFRRYGAAAVSEIETAIASQLLIGQPWTSAVDEVWSITRDVVGERQWMVERIVRTETSAAYNGIALEAIREEDSPKNAMQKKLVAVFDSRTARDSKLLDGQTQPVDEPFFDPVRQRTYMAPPNRPNDRELVIPWRADYRSSTAFNRSTHRAPSPDPPAPGTMAPMPRARRAGAGAATADGARRRLRSALASAQADQADARRALRAIPRSDDAMTVARRVSLQMRTKALDGEIATLRGQLRGLRKNRGGLPGVRSAG